jgi:hypothetical protein
MTSDEWIYTLRQIPEAEHGKLVLVLQNGTEICVDLMFRFEDTFLIMRGRQGGSIDEGRAFIVPYDQLLCLRLDRNIRLEDLENMFGVESKQKPRLASLTDTPLVPRSEQPTPVAPTDAAGVSRLLLERIKAVRASSASRMGSISTLG